MLPIILPAARVHLRGLSAAQVASLSANYAGFIGEEEALIGGADAVECCACRLAQRPAVSAEQLSRDGQYALRQQRRSDGIALTGVNFAAWFAPRASRRPAWLGVAEEHELSQANVIENFLRVLMAHRALALGGVVLHSAGLAIDSRAYVFAGRSGAGKTTLTRKAHAQGARVLSDDINLLLPGQGRYLAQAVPFTGEFGRTLPPEAGQDTCPLACLVLLEPGDRLHTAPVTASEAVARLLANCPFVNTDAEETAALFEVLTELVMRVPVIRLRSRRDDGFDRVMAAVTTRIGNG